MIRVGGREITMTEDRARKLLDRASPVRRAPRRAVREALRRLRAMRRIRPVQPGAR